MSDENSSTKQLIDLFKATIPLLDDQARKGTSGRIGIIGGSKNYTGAPYYSAMSSLRVGADLVYVICCKLAGQTLKNYSPELIVSPILDDESFKSELSTLVSKLHSLVIGPGLGRDKEQFAAAAEAIKLVKKNELPIIIDADAVLLVAEHPDLIKGYKKAILTPNAREFDYLCDKVGIGSALKSVNLEDYRTKVHELSKKLEGVTVIRKGKIDLLSNGIMQIECTLDGSGRRCGGQGDVLAGVIGTFSYWTHSSQLIETKNNAAILAAYIGCCLTRRTNLLTFKKFGRSTLTTDMLNYIGEAFISLGFK